MSKNFKITIFYSLFIIFSVTLVIGIGASIGILINISKSLPSLEPLEDYTGDPDKWSLPSKVYDRNNNLIAEYATEKRELVSYKELPKDLVYAFVASEDNRFFKHRGIDFVGIIRAIFVNIKAGEAIQGGSTITQQLAKVLFLTKEKKLKRKIQDALLSIKIEQKYTKEEILERYLNKIYFGHNCYGIKEASRFYFNKALNELTLAECAYLAGLPKAPNRYSIINHSDRARERQMYVLKQMVELDQIDEDRAAKSLKEFWETFKTDTQQLVSQRNRPYAASGYLAEMTRQKLEAEEFEDYAIYRGGLIIETTFDINLQKEAEKILKVHLQNLNEAWHKNYPDSPEARIEGAIVTIKQNTGEIIVACGGSGFNVKNQLNRVYQIHRQPGSAFKPFLYLAALDSGKFTASSLLLDQPAYFFPYAGAEPWIPDNYDGKYQGWLTLRYGLEHSINVASIRLMEELAPTELSHYEKQTYSGNLIIDYAKKLGIKSHLEPVWSLPLGPYGVTPLEMAEAFGTIANGGVYVESIFIKNIRDRDNTIIKTYVPLEREVIGKDVAYLLTHILEGVVRRGTAAYSIGSYFKGRPLGGKTGTTNNFVDAWFIGFSPQYTTAVWVGFDQGSTSLGPKMSGGRVAAPIWRDFNLVLLKDLPMEPFPKPDNILLIPVCYETGKLATDKCPSIIEEAFICGTEPDEVCELHKEGVTATTLEFPEETIESLFYPLDNVKPTRNPDIEKIEKKPFTNIGKIRDRQPFGEER
ncbi:MAG: PBP1A family penicillin-binding protein [Candidatus Hydrogenedentota bacterium]